MQCMGCVCGSSHNFLCYNFNDIVQFNRTGDRSVSVLPVLMAIGFANPEAVTHPSWPNIRSLYYYWNCKHMMCLLETTFIDLETVSVHLATYVILKLSALLSAAYLQ